MSGNLCRCDAYNGIVDAIEATFSRGGHTMRGLKENLDWFPRYQAYLRNHRAPTLHRLGTARLYARGLRASVLRDLPEAELHPLDARCRA
jgi:xanthine dehydrogenase iron-sulfur cluster and FAD-binding subunit A